jgi:hypothetical protein
MPDYNELDSKVKEIELEILKLDLEIKKIQFEEDKASLANQEFYQKDNKIDKLLMIINTLSDKYVGDKELKTEIGNLAAKKLKELLLKY